MQELSLHVLDLLENSARAGATAISVTVDEDAERDLLAIGVEDDGPGLPVPAEQALDPFFTTKEAKRTGLGLSLFRLAAEQAGGGLEAGRSELLGGAAVRARLGLRNIDRAPLGDLAATVLSILLTHEGLDVLCTLRAAGGERVVSTAAVAVELGGESWFDIARTVSARINEGMREIGMGA
jgi:signal transduction histidine kinase